MRPMRTEPFLRTVDPLDAAFAAQRAAFAAERFPSLAQRLSRLDRLAQLLQAHEAGFVAAIDADFSGRSPH